MTATLPERDASRAAVRAVLAAVDEGTITPPQAVRQVSADQVRALLRPVLAPDGDFGAVLCALGVPASPGAAYGIGVGSQAEAREEPGAVLVRPGTEPQDANGLVAAEAVVTEAGDLDCHAAVWSRALDTPCVIDCGPGTLDALDGQDITVDGDSGRIWVGELPITVTDEERDEDLRRLLAWAQASSPVTVACSADGAPGPVFDADALPPEELAAGLPAIPAGTKTVAGGLFGTPDGIRAALDAGAQVIVAPRRLPVLLAAIAWAGR